MAKSSKKKKISTVLYVILGLIVAVALGALAWFLYMQFSPVPSPPAGEFTVVTPPGGRPTLVPKAPAAPSTASSFAERFGAPAGLSDLM